MLALMSRISRLVLSAAALTVLVLAVSYTTPDPKPTVILVSLDGFRPDYLTRYNPSTLNELAREGVRAEFLKPIFPTKTFPNHYAIVTGRYAENHGIVSNTMWDAKLGRFSLSNRAAVADGRWWDDAEPIWVTLEKAGIKSAMYFWPGSEAEIRGVRPAYYKRFSVDSLWEARIRWVVQALEHPPGQRPQLISLYFEDVDTAGHRYGPDSDSMRAAVARVDRYLSHLIDRLSAMDRLEAVNLVVTSDHGMAATFRDSVVFLEDFVDLDSVIVTDWDPVLALDPVDEDADKLLAKLRRMPHVTFHRKEDMPARFHYSSHDRIRAIIGIADVGWRIARGPYFQATAHRLTGGNHGYDPEAVSMHGIFIARGPAFRRGSVVAGFDNIHVYELLCAIFNVVPAQNDGNLEIVQHLFQ